MQEIINTTTLDTIFFLILIITMFFIINNYKKEKTIKIIIREDKEALDSLKKTSIQLTKNFKEITSSFYNKNLNQISNMINKDLLKLINLKIENDNNNKIKENRFLIDVESTKITKKLNNKILVEFSSLQTAYSIDKDGVVKKGCKNQIIKVKDFWLFKKNSKNKWILEEVLDIKSIKK